MTLAYGPLISISQAITCGVKYCATEHFRLPLSCTVTLLIDICLLVFITVSIYIELSVYHGPAKSDFSGNMLLGVFQLTANGCPWPKVILFTNHKHSIFCYTTELFELRTESFFLVNENSEHI